MKKRVLSFLLAAAVAGSIFAACGSSGSKSASYDTATSESAASAYGDYYVDEESNGTSYEAEDGVEAKNSDNACTHVIKLKLRPNGTYTKSSIKQK